MRKLKKTKVKLLVTLLSFVLLFCGTMGSSLAWLLDTTDPVKNEFDSSTIGVTLTENEDGDDGTLDSSDKNKRNYKMIPGWTIDKIPKVTVQNNSEDCYVFIKAEESPNLNDYIAYDVNSDWIPLIDSVKAPEENASEEEKNAYQEKKEEYDGIYYRRVLKTETDNKSFYILGEGSLDDSTFSWAENQVLTLPSVTKEMMDALTDQNKPTLTFTAAAVQYYKSNNTPFEVEEAYNLVDWTKATNP